MISFPLEDILNGLTKEAAHRAVEAFCKENFCGYQRLLATHTDTDNYHVHIVINSVRDLDIKPEPWMIRAVDGSIQL